MAHKKAAGGGVRQHKNPTGKRLGVKKAHGSKVVSEIYATVYPERELVPTLSL